MDFMVPHRKLFLKIYAEMQKKESHQIFIFWWLF